MNTSPNVMLQTCVPGTVSFQMAEAKPRSVVMVNDFDKNFVYAANLWSA
jgi:hypothetical protein